MQPSGDLLQPSLTGARAEPVSLYSLHAAFFTSFFGGPFAALAIFGINSQRLGRLGRDVPLYAACAVVFFLLLWWQHRLGGNELLVERFGRSGPQFVFRLAGLACFAAGWLAHRSYHRNAAVMGLSPPRGFVTGVVCVAIGVVLFTVTVAFIRTVVSHR